MSQVTQMTSMPIKLPPKAVEAAARVHAEFWTKINGFPVVKWEDQPEMFREEACKGMALAISAFLRAWL